MTTLTEIREHNNYLLSRPGPSPLDQQIWRYMARQLLRAIRELPGERL